MKYKIKQFKDGDWAVFQGSKVFMDTKTTDKAKADCKALMMSALWYMNKFRHTHSVMAEKYPDTIDDNDPWGYTA